MSIYCRCMLVITVSAGLLCTNLSAKTKLVRSWADPAAANYKFSKVLTLAVIENNELRSRAESAMAKNIKRVKAVPSYTVLPKEEVRDIERAKQKVREGGFDSAVVLRLFAADSKVQYVAPTTPDPYVNYSAYTNFIWPTGATPGYVKYDQIVQVEMLFFSLSLDKVLWAGVLESSNPQDAWKLIDDIAKVIAKELQKKGLFK
jgi:hypothetical protein